MSDTRGLKGVVGPQRHALQLTLSLTSTSIDRHAWWEQEGFGSWSWREVSRSVQVMFTYDFGSGLSGQCRQTDYLDEANGHAPVFSGNTLWSVSYG